MSIINFVLFLLLLPACVPQVIPFQSHSFNDLDYVIQQLIKGVDSFKIDVSAIDRPSCLQYSTWQGKDNKCEIDESRNKICCLGLRGDASSAPKLNDYFNTTDELLSVLENPKYDFIWQQDKRLARYNRTIYIAINTQYTFVDGEITKSWMSKMIRTIRERNLDIKLVLGSPRIANYYGNLCEIEGKQCDEDSRVIASYPFILQGATSVIEPPPYGVIENFNIIFEVVPEFCEKGFPTYADAMPYYFYEVAHEEDIIFTAEAFMSDQCKRSETHPDLSSVRITSNVDPEMVQTYLPHENPFDGLVNVTNILIETLQADELVILSYFDPTQNMTHIEVRSLNESLKLVSEAQIEGPAPTKISYKAPYLYLQGLKNAEIYLLGSNSALALTPKYKISSTSLAADLFVYDSECYFVQVEAPGECSNNSLSFTLTNMGTGKQIVTQCSDQIQAFDVSKIQNADLSLALDSSDTLRGVMFVSAAYEGAGGKKDALYAISLRFNMELAIMDFGGSLYINLPKSYIDFGVDPGVKVIENNGSLFVLEGHSNGICQCAAMINNGNAFKCGISNTTNLHLAHLQNVEYLMNYNWGRLDDFEERIQSGQYVNGCDSRIMHAKFSNGANPNGIVFRNTTTNTLQALFVNQYVEYGDLPFMTKLFCGAIKPKNKEVTVGSARISVFDIVDFELFDYL